MNNNHGLDKWILPWKADPKDQSSILQLWEERLNIAKQEN